MSPVLALALALTMTMTMMLIVRQHNPANNPPRIPSEPYPRRRWLLGYLDRCRWILGSSQTKGRRRIYEYSCRENAYAFAYSVSYSNFYSIGERM